MRLYTNLNANGELNMYERWGELIKRAELEVIEFGCHIRREMNVIGRCNTFYVMSYLKTGEAVVRMNGQEYKTPAGSIVLIPPDTVHDHIKTSKEEAIFLWWHFRFTVAGDIDILKLLRLPVVTMMNNTELFEKIFTQYMDTISKTDSLPALIYKNAKGLEVLSCLFGSILSSTETGLEAGISDVFRDILMDVSKEPKANISLTWIAKKYHMNPTYISNRFKNNFGISPIFLHRKLLEERAKELLHYSTQSIGEISNALEFSDIAVFTRFFTERTGVSPSKYRNTK